MDQRLFNNLVYWALKYYQVRMDSQAKENLPQMEAARYFFVTLWNATHDVKANEELLKDVLNEEQIDLLAYQYRLVNDLETIQDVQDYYTQLVVQKINYYSHTYYSWTLQSNEIFSFGTHLLHTHKMELGIGAVSGIVSFLSMISNQMQLATVSSLPGMGLLTWFGYYYYQWYQLHQNQLQIPVQYIVNPHRQYKIWLSSDGHEIPDYLMSYILQPKKMNVASKSIVYDKELISDIQYEQLMGFSEKFAIRMINVREDVFHLCKTSEEQELIRIYQQEIQNLSNGGCLELAHQVLRWLRPVYELGLYTETDILINLQDFPEIYAFKQPIIFNLSRDWNERERNLKLNHDILMVVDSIEAKDVIKEIQNQIIQAYHFNYHYLTIDKPIFKQLRTEMMRHPLENGNFEHLQKERKAIQESIDNRKSWIQILNLLQDKSDDVMNKEKKEHLEEIKKEMLKEIVEAISGKRIILRGLVSYLDEYVIDGQIQKNVNAYSFNYYDMLGRFHKKTDEKEYYDKELEIGNDEIIVHEDIDVIELQKEDMDKSAKIIQRFFKNKVILQQETSVKQQIGGDWELVVKI